MKAESEKSIKSEKGMKGEKDADVAAVNRDEPTNVRRRLFPFRPFMLFSPFVPFPPPW